MIELNKKINEFEFLKRVTEYELRIGLITFSASGTISPHSPECGGQDFFSQNCGPARSFN
jgi:hypothetical protein